MTIISSDFKIADITQEHMERLALIRQSYQEMEKVLLSLPESRTRSLALTNLEQSYLWATNAAIEAD